MLSAQHKTAIQGLWDAFWAGVFSKRFPEWRERVVALAHELALSADKTERWIGQDVLKELERAQ